MRVARTQRRQTACGPEWPQKAFVLETEGDWLDVLGESAGDRLKLASALLVGKTLLVIRAAFGLWFRGTLHWSRDLGKQFFPWLRQKGGRCRGGMVGSSVHFSTAPVIEWTGTFGKPMGKGLPNCPQEQKFPLGELCDCKYLGGLGCRPQAACLVCKLPKLKDLGRGSELPDVFAFHRVHKSWIPKMPRCSLQELERSVTTF